MQYQEEPGKSGLTLRAIAVAALLAVLLAGSSVYIALSLGAMPWPIIISVVASMALLKFLGGAKHANIHEMNVAQAGASIGGVLASALAFTIPGMWLLSQKGVEIEPLGAVSIALISITAGTLGILLSAPLRKVFVEEENLPFASGKAGADVLIAGDAGGSKARAIIIAGAAAGLFMAGTYAAGIPVLSFPSLAGAGVILAIALFMLPMAAGIGYILGPRISLFSWFGGALFGWGVLIPLLYSQGTGIDDAISMAQNLGMGILLGSGAGFLVTYVLPNAKKIFGPMLSGGGYSRAAPLLSLFAFLLLTYLGVPALASLIAVLGVWVVAGVAARMTGETDIDPYEQFGIVIVVAAGTMLALLGMNLGYFASFAIVSFVTVAAAVVGDIGFDYKSAKIIGTKASDILKVDLLAVVVAGISAPFFLELIRQGYQRELFTPAMPATQAALVAGSIGGFAHPNIFLIGFALALLWELGSLSLFRKKTPFSAMAFGIGVFIGFALSIPFAIGGALRWIVERKRPEWVEVGALMAAGAMGGVGIGGFARAVVVITGAGATLADYALAAVFAIALAAGIFLETKGRRKK